MIITVDGLDGCGKSTLAKKLAKRLNFRYVDKPLYQLFNVTGDDNPLYELICMIQDSVYNQTDSDRLKAWFTGMSLLYIKEVFGFENLIVDRGLLSCYAFNGNPNSNLIFECLITFGVWFDLSIFLYASPEVRINRLASRKANEPDLQDDLIINMSYDSVESFLKSHDSLPYICINTDDMNENEVFEFVLDYLKNARII